MMASASAMPAQRFGMLQRQRHHLVEQRFFQRQRLFAGFGDAAGQVASSSVEKRAAPAMVWRWRNRSLFAISLSACCWRHFDEIAQHAIMLDAQHGDAAVLAVFGFPARR